MPDFVQRPPIQSFFCGNPQAQDAVAPTQQPIITLPNMNQNATGVHPIMPGPNNPFAPVGSNPLMPLGSNPFAPGGMPPLTLNVTGAPTSSQTLNQAAGWTGLAGSVVNSAGQYATENPNFLSQTGLQLGPNFGPQVQTYGNGLGMAGGGMQFISGGMDVVSALNGDISAVDGYTGAGNMLAGGAGIANAADGMGYLNLSQNGVAGMQALALAPDVLNLAASIGCGAPTHEQYLAASQLGVNAVGTYFPIAGMSFTAANTVVGQSGWAPGAPTAQEFPGMVAYSIAELGPEEFMNQLADGLADDNRTNIFGDTANMIGDGLHWVGLGGD